MKTKKIIFLPLLLILINCNEPAIKKEVRPEPTIVETDEFSDLNNRLKKIEHIDTPVELIKYYYGEVDNEGDIDIEVMELGKGHYTITLIHDNIRDDSIAGMKIIMTANQNNKIWTVRNIARSWKCQKGRGHTKYSSEPCL